MIKLAPSILAADFCNLGEQIKLVENAGVQYLHIDVMDGAYVPSISFGMPVISSIRKHTDLFFDVHLMVEEPIRYISDFKASGADLITVHAEACKHLHKTIFQIKELGMKVGVSLNPSTPLDVLEYVLADLDMVLIMSVNPGFGGQKFIPFSLEKIMKLKEMIDQTGKSIDIQVDGGVSLDNVTQVLEAGANVLVAGTAIFGGDITANVKAFQEKFKEFEGRA